MRHGARCATRSWISLEGRRSPRAVAGIGHHQPPAVLTHREADQRQAVRTVEAAYLVLASYPIEGDVGQQPVIWIRLPLEGQTEFVTHPAVRAVAAHHVAGAHLGLVTREVPEGGVDGLPLLGEAHQFDALLDRATELRPPARAAAVRSRSGEGEG